MSDLNSIYCDESCHLEHDGQDFMVLGGVWCPTMKRKEIYSRIRELKEKGGLAKHSEVKWTKISKKSVSAYLNLIDYFFDDDDLHFRAYVIRKDKLNHEKFNQTHNDFYYKMYFEMLKAIISNDSRYDIYVDIKDTIGDKKVQKLREVLCNSIYDFDRGIIRRIQQIRSDEIELVQLADLLIGATMAANRGGVRSEGKNLIIDRIKERSHYSLTKSTLLGEKKFNIYIWQGDGQ